MSPDQPLHFVVDRGGKTIDITVTPELKTFTDRFGNTMRMGLLGIQRNADRLETATRQFNFSWPDNCFSKVYAILRVVLHCLEGGVPFAVGAENFDPPQNTVRVLIGRDVSHEAGVGGDAVEPRAKWNAPPSQAPQVAESGKEDIRGEILRNRMVEGAVIDIPKNLRVVFVE